MDYKNFLLKKKFNLCELMEKLAMKKDIKM